MTINDDDHAFTIIARTYYQHISMDHEELVSIPIKSGFDTREQALEYIRMHDLNGCNVRQEW